MEALSDKKWFEPRRWLDRLLGRRERPSGLFRVESYLRDHGIDYRVHPHPDAFGASATAESLHLTGKAFAKVVIVRADRRYVMAVLPSELQIHFRRLARLLKVKHVSLATELELKALFPDCEIGAMPPLGNLYGLPVYVDVSLNQEPLLFFAAGTRRAAIQMHYRDFNRLVSPQVGRFAAVPLKRAA